MALLSINLIGRWRQVANIMPGQLPPEKTPNTQTLGRPQSQSGRYEDKKNVLLLMGFEPLIIQPMA
jgi:hypothetical protein